MDIAPLKHNIPIPNSPFCVRMDARKLAAYLCRETKTEWQRTEETVKAILDYLGKQGLKNLSRAGLLEAIPNILEKNEMYLVAQGKEPVLGVDGSIHCLFEADPAEKQWEEDESHQIDFRTRNEINNVKAGDLVAEVIPPAPPKNGEDVFGMVLPAREGKKARITAGTNVKLSPDGQKAFSQIDGCVKIQRGRISVDRVMTVEGNVDFHTGNIRFNGDVVIRGDVKESFSVEADGAIKIQGTVDRAMLKAGGDILVDGGVYGKDDILVEAGGDISIGFAENANMCAGGSIYVRSAMINSNAYAEQKIYFKAMGTSLVGGHIVALHGVEANCLGNPRIGTKTIVEFGPRPELSQQIRLLTTESEQTDSEERRTAIEKELVPLQELFQELSQAAAIVKFVTYPGVIFRSGSASMDVRTQLAEVVYSKVEGKNEIVMRPYEPESKRRRGGGQR